MLTADIHGLFSLCQDPHLNRFFQQCQKRELDLSLPPTSNFLNCLKVREKALYTTFDILSTATYLISATLTYAKNHFVFCLFLVYISYLFPLFSFSFSSYAFFSALLQGLLSMERIPVIIRFLPVLFNQLFKVLTQNDNDEVTTATTR